jgi:transcriptional regulator with XRE-family HTH domain
MSLKHPTPLLKARNARGLSQEELAHEVGTDSGNISRIERGNQIPLHELAIKLTEFFREDGLDDERMIFYPHRYPDWSPKTAVLGD